jgi:hypothetical protein
MLSDELDGYAVADDELASIDVPQGLHRLHGDAAYGPVHFAAPTSSTHAGGQELSVELAPGKTVEIRYLTKVTDENGDEVYRDQRPAALTKVSDRRVGKKTARES